MHQPHRRMLAVAAATVLATGAGLVVANEANAAAGCRVSYTVNQWSTGFTGNIALTNLGDPISNGWRLEWSFAGNQHITQGWSGTFAQTGQHVTVTNPSWSPSLPSNGSASLGFNADYSGTNATPAQFTLNGTVCTGTAGPGPSPSDPGPSPSDPGPSNPPPGNKVDNPYAGVQGYRNPEWQARANAEPGGSRVANNPTAVWVDIQFVIYNLPGRDCSALASNGELGVNDLPRYKAEYIDPIAAIMADPRYAGLRIINIVEIDSLPNLVTNTNVATCATMKANGGYVQGIGYALNKLGALPNAYNYVDAAHHGWIGWDSNFGPSAQQMLAAAQASGSVHNVNGFITNTANYSALTEPNFTINTSVNGTSVRQSKWVDWNQYVDELSFAQAFRTQLVSVGFDSTIGMLIDTSRNGWGGSARPTGPSTSTNVDTFVNQSKIDRRIHAGNWCNQSGAGLGERPRANPATGIDAYVWVKPPGESDGSSTLIPNDEGKGFDRMCDPTYTGNERNGNNPTGAMSGAPISGAWFSAQFRELMANAYPPLS
jgi:cellulose 1,4-beta-cellobiosidase